MCKRAQKSSYSTAIAGYGFIGAMTKQDSQDEVGAILAQIAMIAEEVNLLALEGLHFNTAERVVRWAPYSHPARYRIRLTENSDDDSVTIESEAKEDARESYPTPVGDMRNDAGKHVSGRKTAVE